MENPGPPRGEPDLPVNAGVSLLLAAGVLYGLKNQAA
ncbi:PID-CTERM protein-sorting domain-containing protein [Pedobacter ginsengisoli]